MDNKVIATNKNVFSYKKDNGDTNIDLLINGETLWGLKNNGRNIWYR